MSIALGRFAPDAHTGASRTHFTKISEKADLENN